MKNFLIFFIFIYLLFLNTAYALEKGKWIFVKDDEYCYIGSIPIETDLPKEKKRGDIYINDNRSQTQISGKLLSKKTCRAEF